MDSKIKDIKGFEGLYAITDDGRVWSYPRPNNVFVGNQQGKWLKGYKTPNGYKSFHLRIGKKHFYKLAHRLVSEAFIPNTNCLKTVNHRNCNKLDNNVSNLEWCSLKENLLHRDKNRLLPSGESHHNTYLTKKQILKMRKMYNNGFHKVTKIAGIFKIPRGTAKNILNGRTWIYV